MSRKKIQKTRKTKTITFQPTPETAEKIALIKKQLGLGKSQIVRICVEQHLPFLLRKHIALTQSIAEGVPEIIDPDAPNSVSGVSSHHQEPNGSDGQHADDRPSRERKK